MLASEAQRPLICWEPVNSRIISAQFATQSENIKRIIIQCYTLTNYAIEEKKLTTTAMKTSWTHGMGRMNKNRKKVCWTCAPLIMLLLVPGRYRFQVLNRIILERMKALADPLLQDQQAGFLSNRSCTEQIVTRSTEWDPPPSAYINFIHNEKAFDIVDREILCKLLRHDGTPTKIISPIQNIYRGMSCRVLHAGQLSESFKVKTGVLQGCLLSPFMFLLVIDWIMKTTTCSLAMNWRLVQGIPCLRHMIAGIGSRRPR